MPKIKLLIACCSTLSRIGLRNLLAREKDFVVVKEASNEDDAAHYAEEMNPDIILLCFHILIESKSNFIAKIKERIQSGRVTTKRAAAPVSKQKFCRAKLSFAKKTQFYKFVVQKPRIVVFNSSFTEDQELQLVKEGVVGIFRHNCPSSDLIKALRRVHAGEFCLGKELIASLIGSQLVKGSGDRNLYLTKRELEVLSEIAGGYKNQDIASKFCIAENTVRTHINNIFKKLEIHSRLQATLYAVKHNLLSR